MSTVFISYASEDREHAKTLALALERHGLAVWWDRKIPLGQAFDEVIEEQLAAAGCVLVLWTHQSVESRWVRAEASAALERDQLIPLLLEPEVRIPLEFRLLQAADLSHWDGNVEQPEFQTVLTHVRAMLQRHDLRVPSSTPSRRTAAAAPSTSPAVAVNRTANRGRRIRNIAMYMVLPSAVMAVAVVLAMNWHLPTRVHLDLLVDRISFYIDGEEAVRLPPDPLNFKVLRVENFDEFHFTPRAVLQGSGNSGVNPARAFAPLMPVAVKAEAQSESLLMLEGPATLKGNIGRLESISLSHGSHVVLETRPGSPPRLTVRVDGQELNTNILPSQEIDITLSDAKIDGGNWVGSADEPLTLRVALAADRPVMQLRGTRRSFTVAAGLEPAHPLTIVSLAPVQGVQFKKQRDGGQLESALVGEGTISFPRQPGITAQKLARGDFLELGEREKLVIENLQMRPDGSGMEVRLDGEASEIAAASGGLKRDLRLTAFEAIWNDAQAAVLLSVTVWAMSMSAGAYRLYREFAATT